MNKIFFIVTRDQCSSRGRPKSVFVFGTEKAIVPFFGVLFLARTA